eukprot:1116149_1
MDDSDSVTERVDVGSSARLVIGHRGETIRNIEEACNVTAGIVGELGESQRVKLSGERENVARAKKMIVDKLASSVTERVDVGSSARLILGHSGETIQRIQEMCNVTADIVGELGESEWVEITGEREDVTRAKKMVADKLASSVPRLVIGHRGETIRNIEEACNVTAETTLSITFSTIFSRALEHWKRWR